MGIQQKGSNLTTLCYIEQGGRYLMLHRVKKENDINKDKWIGVGGHFEAGESVSYRITCNNGNQRPLINP